KFLPGVNPLAAALAGAIPIRPESFAVHALAGALLWAGAWITLGYLFADVIGRVASQAARLGRPLGVAIGVGLLVYVVIKFGIRRRFLRHLRKARIEPIELKRRLEAGDHLVIVDLRTVLDVEQTSYRIPGARWIPPEHLDDPHQLIPRGSEVVF